MSLLPKKSGINYKCEVEVVVKLWKESESRKLKYIIVFRAYTTSTDSFHFSQTCALFENS